MRKIPTLFRRDPTDMRRLLREVHPDCQWVPSGEGVATRKYDGTCVMFDGAEWWGRREVKAGKAAPLGFVEVGRDDETGKRVGWEPATQSAFTKFLGEAITSHLRDAATLRPGTYELCGPRVNQNPEGYTDHVLVLHDNADVIEDVPSDFDDLAKFLADFPHEGIVWHHPDGRMAKLKRRDLLR